MSRKQPTPPPAGVVKPDPPPAPPIRDHGTRFVHQNDPPYSLPPLSVGRVHLGAHAGLPEIPVNVQPPRVKPPAPDLDADLLAALRFALAEGCSAEDLMAGVRQARDASVCRRSPGSCTCGMHVTPAPREWGAEPANPWTYRVNAEPVGGESRLYETARHLPGSGRKPFADVSLWDGSKWFDMGVYAWRPIALGVPPPPDPEVNRA